MERTGPETLLLFLRRIDRDDAAAERFSADIPETACFD